MKPFEYAIPASREQAVRWIEEGAVAKAGGIDLLDQMKEGLIAPARLVNLASLPELRTVRLDDGGLVLGAGVTLARIAADDGIHRRYPALAQAAGSAANPQIRNVATVGGNLCQRPRCWYFRHAEFVCLKKGGVTCFAKEGEHRYHAIFGGGPSYIVHPSTMATALSACGASLHLMGAGKGRDVPLERFYTLPEKDAERENVLQPGEVITEIRVPASTARSAYLAAKERQVFDWPLGEVAVALDLRGEVIERARVILGAVAPIPWRADAAEAALVGKRLGPSVAEAAGRAAVAGARPLRDNGYKVPLMEALVRRAVLAAGGRS